MTSSGLNEASTANASASDIASIVNSMQSLTGSKLSVVDKRPKSPTAEQLIAEFLEKAKFYTSLCLGK